MFKVLLPLGALALWALSGAKKSSSTGDGGEAGGTSTPGKAKKKDGPEDAPLTGYQDGSTRPAVYSGPGSEADAADFAAAWNALTKEQQRMILKRCAAGAVFGASGICWAMRRTAAKSNDPNVQTCALYLAAATAHAAGTFVGLLVALITGNPKAAVSGERLGAMVADALNGETVEEEEIDAMADELSKADAAKLEAQLDKGRG